MKDLIIEKVRRRKRNGKRIPLNEGINAVAVIRRVAYNPEAQGNIWEFLKMKARNREQWGLYRVRERGSKTLWSLWLCSHGEIEQVIE